ncbi:secreted protein containing duf1501 : Uncharacterized protein OS=Planctomyces maris DSM 8797 GN=PM8797T_09209 PE=4 SV=1: DUF1501 [Gemmataceae bacterium]|nr:secreted protein containing duf1501 : Uncharacterized protein OS=Planctomyces maris DSM 8797 GN=PM8797T_09209 PE=4 SV=1: DUF1501 [Gemmataceae bacterium]VTU00308.1 secreted protein containing duf1501 : Uncharacterized protein OS=Planctomyces maris DSM 8797 GN=PM8797T_09209 PE=4 SV=1: DUF1501 [Gemmataceae bacterium]
MPIASRRRFLAATLGGAASSGSGWLGGLAAAAEKKPTRSCVLLWLQGGPATIDMWDLKPGHKNGGPFKEIDTAAPGVRVSEHLPKVAGWMKHLAVVRSMSTKEGDHGRATLLGRTGAAPQPAVQYPTVAASVAKELGAAAADLPNYVSIAPRRYDGLFTGGFLGPKYAPLVIAEETAGDPEVALRVPNLRGDGGRPDRQALLGRLNADFAADHPGAVTDGTVTAAARAAQLMSPAAAGVFDLSAEKDAARDRYGRNLFGQGCLLARRLVEKGVPFVEVTLDGWDTHSNNFPAVQGLCGTLDRAWDALMTDLKDRGLLDTTTVVCMGEFGRTPKINQGSGRDHYPAAWSAVLGGAGVKGGQVVGRTSKDGTAVEERPVSAPDLLATVCRAVGVDPAKQNMGPNGRPIRIVDVAAKPIEELL